MAWSRSVSDGGRPKRAGDVAGVDPALGQPGGGQGPQESCPATQSTRRVAGGQDRGRAAPSRQRADLGAGPAPFVGHHLPPLVDVHRPGHALGRGGEVPRQPAFGAGQRHLVGLREVQHHVGHGPALAARRRGPPVVVQPLEQPGQLRVLLLERHPVVHPPGHAGSLPPNPEIGALGRAMRG